MYGIGVDLGGTNVRAAAVNDSGNILRRVEMRTPSHGTAEEIIASIAGLVEELRNHSSTAGLPIAGIGISIPGLLVPDRKSVRASVNLPSLPGYPIVDSLQERLGHDLPIQVENDGNAATLGELYMGSDHGLKDLALFTLGTGVGGGIVIGGKIVRGFWSMAGELGHIIVETGGHECGCGASGCLEQYASASAIKRLASEHHLDVFDPQAVYNLALAGNSSAVKVFEIVGRSLGRAIGMLANCLNLPLYLIGGGVSAAWDAFEGSMQDELINTSIVYKTAPALVRRAALGSDAGLYGAAWLALSEEHTVATDLTRS